MLVIDNEEAILDGMSLLLTGWGATVLQATGPDEALDAIARADTPQVVICDYHLGAHDGLDVVALLRERVGAGLPAILLTADRSAEVRDAAAEAEITVLNKPVKPAALRAVLSQWRARAAAE